MLFQLDVFWGVKMLKRIIVVILFVFIAKQVLSESTTLKSNEVLNISLVGPRTESVDFADYQQIFYVSIKTGSNKQGDGSLQKPWKTISYALSKINNASRSRKFAIIVASGTYDTETIIMKEYVDIYGGFSPRSWKRDIFKYATILDGCRVRRVVVGANHSRIDGFTITRGLARSHGGGIICDDTSPIISNNFIIDNFVLDPKDFDNKHIHQKGNIGGGIACLYNAVPIIRNNIIADNKTSIGCGGGIAFWGWRRISGDPAPKVENNMISGGQKSVVENNVLFNNISGINDSNDTRSSNGGGISCAFGARPIIRNNVISGNQARGNSDAGGIYCEYFSYPEIEGNWIVGNICDDDGGAIYVMRMSQPIIKDNIIAGNKSRNGGVGGIRLSKEGRALITNNTIISNLSGGGVRCIDSYMVLEDNIIMNNRGGGIIYSNRFSYFVPSIIRRNIVRENDGRPLQIDYNAGQPLIVEENNMAGKYAGHGNYDCDPEFQKDGVYGNIKSAQFDSIYYTTNILLLWPVEKGNQLSGRVLHWGNQWGVVETAHNKCIVVWGNLTSASKRELSFEIIPSYCKTTRY